MLKIDKTELGICHLRHRDRALYKHYCVIFSVSGRLCTLQSSYCPLIIAKAKIPRTYIDSGDTHSNRIYGHRSILPFTDSTFSRLEHAQVNSPYTRS